MFKKIFWAICIGISLMVIIIATSWTPFGDIDLKNTFQIINATNISAGYLSGNLIWNDLYGYPVACPTYSAITKLNDSVICTDSWVHRDGDTMTGNLSVNANLTINGTSRLGNNTSYLAIDNYGVVTMIGSAKRDLTLRPDLDSVTIRAKETPDQVTLGVFKGYSLPLYVAAPENFEELFFSLSVPGRWDEASNITIDILVALSQGETVDDDFNLQLSWENSEEGEPIVATTHDVEMETNIPTGRNAQYDTYLISFVIDYDIDPAPIAAHDLLAIRIRRIAVTGTEIAGEVIVLDAHVHFIVDKMYNIP